MIVFKFGGASVQDAEAVRNLATILHNNGDTRKVVVVSAMNKTTNKLESVVNAFVSNGDWKTPLNEVFDFHKKVLIDLLQSDTNDAGQSLEKVKHYAFTFLEQDEGSDVNFIYDQIVALGEILSTKIISSFLSNAGIDVIWADARKLIQTDNTYRDARVDWKHTTEKIQEYWQGNAPHSIVTQGFIGGGEHQRMTTLGREGSDFSAAIFAYALDAKSVTIWKDVPGMLNADPKLFTNTSLLPNISYREAIELSYYGASVIHPKTIKPLENKNIPLHVKSFLEPTEPGTIINDNTSEDSKIPSYIFKTNQVLLSISSRDFSFIVEEHMSEIFACFARHKLKIQTMQNSAISLSVSVSDQRSQIEALIEELQKDYQVLYNDGLELLTIRHYNEKIVEELVQGKEVMLQQKTRHTMRLLMRA
ncbi:MAG: aspartate kinase [Flavobacteriales bacterium]|nr:aspartate kinase [Flavobacteriales bacterium]